MMLLRTTAAQPPHRLDLRALAEVEGISGSGWIRLEAMIHLEATVRPTMAMPPVPTLAATATLPLRKAISPFDAQTILWT